MARTNCNVSPNAGDKKPPAKKETPRKYTKGGTKTTPPTATSLSSKTINFFVVGLKSDDWLILCDRGNGLPPYTFPTETCLKNNQKFQREILHVHQIHPQVHPNNPEECRGEKSLNSTFERRFAVFVNILTDANRMHNTPEKREAWARVFVNYFNHPKNQAKYTYPVSGHFAGDLTPQTTSKDSTSLPCMSEFLTINDTMLVMREALMQEDMVDLVPVGDVLEQEDALQDYFSPAALQIANRRFQHLRHHIPGQHESQNSNNNAEQENPDAFADFQGFNF